MAEIPDCSENFNENVCETNTSDFVQFRLIFFFRDNQSSSFHFKSRRLILVKKKKGDKSQDTDDIGAGKH